MYSKMRPNSSLSMSRSLPSLAVAIPQHLSGHSMDSLKWDGSSSKSIMLNKQQLGLERPHEPEAGPAIAVVVVLAASADLLVLIRGEACFAVVDLAADEWARFVVPLWVEALVVVDPEVGEWVVFGADVSESGSIVVVDDGLARARASVNCTAAKRAQASTRRLVQPTRMVLLDAIFGECEQIDDTSLLFRSEAQR